MGDDHRLIPMLLALFQQVSLGLTHRQCLWQFRW